jgi:hypothetical protein
MASIVPLTIAPATELSIENFIFYLNVTGS